MLVIVNHKDTKYKMFIDCSARFMSLCFGQRAWD